MQQSPATLAHGRLITYSKASKLGNVPSGAGSGLHWRIERLRSLTVDLLRNAGDTGGGYTDAGALHIGGALHTGGGAALLPGAESRLTSRGSRAILLYLRNHCTGSHVRLQPGNDPSNPHGAVMPKLHILSLFACIVLLSGAASRRSPRPRLRRRVSATTAPVPR